MYQPDDPRLAIIHKYLVRAAETEMALPSLFKATLMTLWPYTASERNVDYKPDRTVVTYCKPTPKQIDAHDHAVAMVVETLADPIDRQIVWAVAHSAAFRDRGPKWRKLAQKFKGLGKGYPKYEKALKSRYEQALFRIYCLQNTTDV